jgi:MSHA biogenesis protein MshL
MSRLFSLFLVLALGACATQYGAPYGNARKEMDTAARKRTATVQPEGVNRALLPSLTVEMPKVDGRPIEPRFDLVVNGAPANQVFMAIVSGTRYSMVVHPSIKEAISINLKDVTVFEALDTIREMYGYEYKLQGPRILIQPIGLQTHVFQINYLMTQRKGRTEVRVTSGAISDSPGAAGQGAAGTPATPTGTGLGRAMESSKVTTTSEHDFWADIGAAVRAIIGAEGGRNVVMSPQSGVVVVRAYPAELRGVEEFLKAMQIVVERQVMLEAKIIEVQLSDSHQSGVNWAAFTQGPNSRFSGGVLSPGSTLQPNGALSAFTTLSADGSVAANSLLTSDPAAPVISAGVGTPGSLFGLAFQTGSFAALISFLETQGDLQVLSSPRIATLNNQKAVLKVGTDEFFVTNVTSNTVTTVAGTTQSPTITVAPFFSGVALDVTPQIDQNSQIILHIHPSVSNVIEKTKNIDLGTSGNFRLPLASSSISESDTIVRVSDGNIVAIGGLMKETSARDSSGLPGLSSMPWIGGLFGSKRRSVVKNELVILLKPTVIESDASWRQDILDTKERIDAYQRSEPLSRNPLSKSPATPAQ